MTKRYAQEVKVAIEAALAAVKLSKKIQQKLIGGDVLKKKDLTPVSIGDFCCQVVINSCLLNAFPNDQIMGEEDSHFLRDPKNEIIKQKILEWLGDLRLSEKQIFELIDRGNSPGSQRFWVVDPIDGTRGFIQKRPYVIALALIEEGEVKVGALGYPHLDHEKVLYGVKNEGGYSVDSGQETEIHVSHSKKVLYWDESSSTSSPGFYLAQKLQCEPAPFFIDSQIHYTAVATGEAGLYLRFPVSKTHYEKVWDHAAGQIIVEEAGGIVTDLLGKRLDYTAGQLLLHNRGLVVSIPALFQPALEALKRLLSEEK